MRPSSPDIDGAFSARGVVLVEGISDKLALEALARRLGRDLDAEGVSVLPIGGAQAIGDALDRLGPGGLGVKLAGLCDAAEERHFQRALERAGFGSNLGRADLEALGFYVCDADLEDELVRSLGAAGQSTEASGKRLSPANREKPTPGLEPGTPSLRVKRVQLADSAIPCKCEGVRDRRVRRSPRKSTALQRCVPTVFQSRPSGMRRSRKARKANGLILDPKEKGRILPQVA
jgi:hypothetical protein